MRKISRVVERSLWLFGILAVVLTLIIAGSVFVLARAPGESDDGGTTAPGSHEFWDKDNPDAEFCTQCHSQVAAEMTVTADDLVNPTHNASYLACIDCHGIPESGQGSNAHAANPALCIDCHEGDMGMNSFLQDAHVGMLDDLGEDQTNANWTCIACHTKVSINLTSPDQDPLPLEMEAETFPPIP